MDSEALRYIPFSRSDFIEADIQNLVTVIKEVDNDMSRLLPRCEKSFAELTKFPYIVCVNTPVQALLLSLIALSIHENDEVIIPSYVSPDVGESIEQSGASLVFADIDPESLIISIESIEKNITSKTKAIVIFDTAGLTPDIKPIMKIATSNGIYVIHYTYYNPFYVYNKEPASLPNIIIFANHDPFVSGAIIGTYMERIYNLIKSLTWHGETTSKPANMHGDHANWYYEITNPGFGCPMTGIQCALYLLYLKNAKHYLERRINIAKEYTSLLQSLKDIFLIPQTIQSTNTHTWQLYLLRIIKDAMVISRDEFINELKAKGVEVSVHYIPLHLHPYYAKKYKYNYSTLINTYEVYTSAISLPIYPQLTDDDVRYVAQTIIDTAKRYTH